MGTEAQKELFGGSVVLIQSLQYKEAEKGNSSSNKQEGENGGGQPATPRVEMSLLTTTINPVVEWRSRSLLPHLGVRQKIRSQGT
jgi:hypothetical protein